MHKNNELKELIDIELENLERLSNEMSKLIIKIEKKPSFIEVRAAGSILHDFYCGIEKIFKKIAVIVDHKLSSDENWHSDLLSQMTKPFRNRKIPVITNKLKEKLKEYLRFRHLFRNIYGFELNIKRFKSLCVKMKDILKKLKIELKEFIKAKK